MLFRLLTDSFLAGSPDWCRLQTPFRLLVRAGQLPLLQALIETGKPVIVLLLHGRQVTFGRGNNVLGGLAAMVVGWRPGEEGGPAFLNLISGAVAPSGRLAQAWPRSVGSIGEWAPQFGPP